MSLVNVVAGEYGATSDALSQVSSEIQGAKIGDLSHAVQGSMPTARSISAAVSVQSRVASLLQTQSQALQALAVATRKVGAELEKAEAENQKRVKSQGDAALNGTAARSGSSGAGSSAAKKAASVLNGGGSGEGSRGRKGTRGVGRAAHSHPTTPDGGQASAPIRRPDLATPPFVPDQSGAGTLGGQASAPIRHPDLATPPFVPSGNDQPAMGLPNSGNGVNIRWGADGANLDFGFGGEDFRVQGSVDLDSLFNHDKAPEIPDVQLPTEQPEIPSVENPVPPTDLPSTDASAEVAATGEEQGQVMAGDASEQTRPAGATVSA